MLEIIDSIRLFFHEAGSDKVYHAAIVRADSEGYDVIASYGRRGSTLQHTIKLCAAPLESARKTYDKLITEKTGKGYQIDGDAPAAVIAAVNERDGARSGLPVQLLTEVEGDELQLLLDDPTHLGLEKMDGERRLLQIDASGVARGINRQGLYIPLTQTLTEAARRLPADSILDGELVGDILWIFDVQRYAGESLLELGFARRYEQLRSAIASALDDSSAIRIVPATYAKRDLIVKLRAENAEGIVLRNAHAPYRAGRSESARKFKFYDTCTVEVAAINTGVRSIRMCVYDGSTPVEIGNVTIPPNKDLPAVGDLGEVRYLYAYRGGSLYQPVWLKVRHDVSRADASIEQIKYRREPTV
jgi:bifunctional non-homologous end joining protein LigD